MSRLTWGTTGERFYETGVDRGVLFVDPSYGVVWNGIVSVSESPSGGEPTPYYLDGYKYINLASSEEFEATISAFSSPYEFDVCDGTLSIANGLFVTQQPRKSFNFCYRSKIGNDIDGQGHGYKIHLIYNALASPSDRENNTIGDSVEASTFKWSLTTLPPKTSAYKPTAHMIIDSRLTPQTLLLNIEDILYGSNLTSSRLPMPDELIAMFNNPQLAVTLNVQPITEAGLSNLVSANRGDLEGELEKGIYRATTNTNLNETSVPGIYSLDK